MSPDVKQFKDLEHVSGEGVQLELNGESYTFEALTLKDHAKVRQVIKSENVKAYDEYVKSLDLSERPRLSELVKYKRAILSDIIPETELFEWFNTTEGWQWLVYLSLQHNHSEVTLDQVESWLSDPEAFDAIVSAVQALNTINGSIEEEDDEGSDFTETKTAAPSPSGSQTSPE